MSLSAFQSPSRLSGSISTYTWLSCGNNMSNLVVIGFPKVEEAEQVRLELVAIQEEHLITLEDAVVLEHGSDGHVQHTSMVVEIISSLWSSEALKVL